MSLIEKLQITAAPTKDDGSNKWAAVSSARDSVDSTSKFNHMPTGSQSEAKDFGSNLGGGGVSTKALDQGFISREVKDTEEDECCIMMIGGFMEDESVGFAERNNYMDRM